MTRPATIAGVLALLVALVLSSSAPARDEGDKKTPQEEIAYLKDQVKILEGILRKLEADRTHQERIAKSLEGIEKSLKRLESSPRARVAQSFDPEADSDRQTGDILVVNDLAVTARITINGTTYRIAPGGERRVEGLRTGPIYYSVTASGYGIGPMTRTMVRANKVTTLTIGEPN